ncbi:Ig-like domain-containing protein [Terrisporobacter sp.]|uniref:Ig-like domain-containing protein n=1 Tax=Terrisporobacter sp. TaxID=1965305 RepID=UPI0026336EFE|nr:Ig-like domain-containing protein [Terrisporobacter sp.]
MRIIYERYKRLIIFAIIPLVLVAQYYLFRFGVISPMIKGVNINIIHGEFIQDIDKYVVKLGEPVVLSPGDYIKFPQYAKDPKIKFTILDDSKTIKLEKSDIEDNTVVLTGLKTGYTSVAVMKNSRVLQKATILVVDPTVESLNVSIDGNLKYVGDTAQLSGSVEVDYAEFNDSYDVTYESSNDNVLEVKNNKVKAVGVGRATIYAKSKDKVEAIRFNIVARVRRIEIKKSFNIVVGQTIKLNPKIITSPARLTPPKVKYKFSETKMPVERAVTFDEKGNITGIRTGSEKITISCGEGSNKSIEIITINVKEVKVEDSMIKNVLFKHNISDNKLNIALSWDVLNGANNYDIYIKDNTIQGSNYELYRSITQEEFIRDNKVILNLDIASDADEVNYDIYIVGRNEEGTSKPSNVITIKEIISKNEGQDQEQDKDHGSESEDGSLDEEAQQ